MGDTENSDLAVPSPGPNPPPPRPLEPPCEPLLWLETEKQEREEELLEIRRLIVQAAKANKGGGTIGWLQFSVNAALAVIGGIGLFIYLGQLSAMNMTLREIKKQTPEMQKQAIAAQDQLAQARADSIASGQATSQQLSLMQGQLTQQQQTMKLDQRAWVALNPKVTGPLYFNQDGAWLPIDVEMRNIGRSPAQYVKIWEKLVVSFAPPSGRELESTCALLKKAPASKETNGWALFPNQIGHQAYPGFAPRKDIDAGLVNSGIPGQVGFSLILCADYTMTFDANTHHQTRQAYSVEWIDMTRGGLAMGNFDPEKTQPIPVALDLRIGGYTD